MQTSEPEETLSFASESFASDPFASESLASHSSASPFDLEPSLADEPGSELPAASELGEEREEEELRANARANVRVDDESASARDLPGVNRDTAGRVNIDRRTHAPSVYDEDDY